LIWQGAFIDAARHWTDRGSGFEGPLGDNILKMPGGPDFAVLEKPDATWPAVASREWGYRFLGYKLTPDDRPTFRYSIGDVTIEDFPNPTSSTETGLRRTLTISGTANNLFFRAAAGSKIESAGDGWYRIDGWKIRISGGVPEIRKTGGKAELLVPVRLVDGKAKIELEYVW
jgi:hypothetical protein